MRFFIDETTTTTRCGRRYTFPARFRTLQVQRYDSKEHLHLRSGNNGKYKTQTIPVLTCHRKSLLASFILLILQIVTVDDLNLLPVAFMLFQMGILCLQEGRNISAAAEEAMFQEEWEMVKRRHRVASFEWQVLRQKPDTKIIPIRETDGSISLYAL